MMEWVLTSSVLIAVVISLRFLFRATVSMPGRVVVESPGMCGGYPIAD